MKLIHPTMGGATKLIHPTIMLISGDESKWLVHTTLSPPAPPPPPLSSWKRNEGLVRVH